MIVFFSEGVGLNLLIIIVSAVLVGIGICIRRSEKKKYFGNILLPSALIALSIVFLAITFSFPEEEAGPEAIPHLWIFWTILLCSGILFQVFRGTIDPDPKSGRIGFLLLSMVILTAYYFAMETMGYFLSSFLFLVVLMHILIQAETDHLYRVNRVGSLFLYRILQTVIYPASIGILRIFFLTP